MSHNLNINKGKASFFSLKEKAWHGLGQIVKSAPNSKEAIQLAGLDYEVGLAPLSANLDDNSIVSLPKNFATYRKDTGIPFGVVGTKYTVVQNKDAFSFFDSIVGEGEAIYETAGALGEGEKIFITAKLPDYIKVGKDAIEKYLLLTMAHDGSGAIKAMFTPIRVVCNNTLRMALNRNTNQISIRHTQAVHNSLKTAHKLMGITNQLSEEVGHIFNEMTKVKITDKVLQDYIKNIYLTKEEILDTDLISTRTKNMLNDIHEYAYVGVGQEEETCKGTLFGAYQAITGYYQNTKDYKTLDKKFTSILDNGTDSKILDKSFVVAKNFLNFN